MIQVIAKGPIEIDHYSRIDKSDGWDTIEGMVTVTKTPEVEVNLEFSQGHVNLEGWATSEYYTSVAETFHRYVSDAIDAEQFQILGDEWDVQITADWWGWVQQAHRYQTERPDRSLIDCLKLFRTWDVTDTDRLNTAIEKVETGDDLPSRSGLRLAHVETGDLSDQEWRDLTVALNRLSSRINAQYSYKPEQTA